PPPLLGRHAPPPRSSRALRLTLRVRAPTRQTEPRRARSRPAPDAPFHAAGPLLRQALAVHQRPPMRAPALALPGRHLLLRRGRPRDLRLQLRRRPRVRARRVLLRPAAGGYCDGKERRGAGGEVPAREGVLRRGMISTGG